MPALAKAKKLAKAKADAMDVDGEEHEVGDAKAKQKQAAEAALDKIAEKIVLYERQIGDANNQMDEAMQTMRTTDEASKSSITAYGLDHPAVVHV